MNLFPSLKVSHKRSCSPFALANVPFPPKDKFMYMTTAVDLVITEVEEPVRFLLETRVRVCSPNDRLFWPFSRRNHTESFYLKLRQVAASRHAHLPAFSACFPTPVFPAAQMERKERKSPASDSLYEVVSLESESERERRKTSASPAVLTSGPGATVPSPPEDDEEEGDGPHATFPFLGWSLRWQRRERTVGIRVVGFCVLIKGERSK